MKVSWIGAGIMGLPMARHLLEGDAVERLAVHNRTPERAAPLVEAGARLATSVADAVRDADVVFTMVSFPADVEAVYLGADGILAHARPGALAVDMTTSSPALAARVAEEGARRGVTVLDAPVSGGPAGAENGTLSIMVGGEAGAFDTVRPLLERMGSAVVHHGPAGSGQSAKLVNQALVAGVTLACCESFALGQASGLDIGKLRESVRPGVAGSPLLDFVWSRLQAGDLEPGFKLDHFIKDLGLIAEVSDGLPGVQLVDRIARAVRSDRGGGRGTQALATALPGWADRPQAD